MKTKSYLRKFAVIAVTLGASIVFDSNQSFAGVGVSGVRGTCEDLASNPSVKVDYRKLLQDRVSEAMQIIQSRNADSFPVGVQMDIEPTKDALLGKMYADGLLYHDRLARLASDKLVLSSLLEKLMGPRFREFNPRGVGVKEYVLRAGILGNDGKPLMTEAQIFHRLQIDFPNGLVIKNVEDARSRTVGIYADTAEIARLLSAPNSELVQVDEIQSGKVGAISGEILSGERLFIMDKIPNSLLSEGQTLAAKAGEFRVHILNGKVLREAILPRWGAAVAPSVLDQVAKKVQEFLDLLPNGFKIQQGFSSDVILLQDQSLQIVEINTNRGFTETWSGFMRYPEIIGITVRHLEDQYGWKFGGDGGQALRQDVGNIRQAVKFEFKERIKAIKAGKQTPEDALRMLRSYVPKYMNPLAEFVKGGQNLQKMLEKDLRFSKRYIELLENVRAIPDNGWTEFASWMQSEISGEISVSLEN